MSEQNVVQLQNNQSLAIDTTEHIDAVYAKQLLDVQKTPYRTAEQRIDALKRLYDLIDDNAEQICEALYRDFGCRSEQESMLTDVVGSLSSIRYYLSNTRRFMKPRGRRVSLWYLPAGNKVTPMPLGVAGVMAPWNYPVHLMIAPAAAALAAGNRVMAKMSEVTPITGALMQKLIASKFTESEFCVCNGGVDVSTHFSMIPFDHLLFTGSTAIGRKIAMAAAQNLTPVTLELSGKSPAIVTSNFSVSEAAKRIAWGKSFNSGQTCVAPEYALVPKDRLEEFVTGFRAAMASLYPKGIGVDSFTSIINPQHVLRLNQLVEDAKSKGVEILEVTDGLPSANKVPVTLVINPTKDCMIYSDEVFGPLMSVFTYQDLDDAVSKINSLEDPLAAYVFTNNTAEANHICKSIRAATVCVNEVLLQYLQNDLPFGGRGTSGSGQYHAQEGFDTFSHLQPIFRQRGLGNFTGIKLLYPPYDNISAFMGKLIRKMP